MLQNQAIDTLPEEREKVFAPNAEPTQLGTLAAGCADTVGDRNLLGKVAHPV